MIFFLVLGALVSVFGTSASQPADFVPGEILVRFTRGSEGSAAVDRASTATPPTLDALASVIQGLQNETGIPLRAKKLQAGGWVLLEVDSEKLATELFSRISRAEVAVEVKTGSRSWVIIRFAAESSEYIAVQEKVRSGGDVEFNDLIRNLESETGLPLVAKPGESGELELRVDLRELTSTLVLRLKSLCGVESAQPNFLLTIR